MKTDEQIEAAIHPAHYNDHPSGIETFSIIEGFPGLLFAAAKYMLRLGKKDAPVQELGKARVYIERYRDHILGTAYDKPMTVATPGFRKFATWWKTQDKEGRLQDSIIMYIGSIGSANDIAVRRDNTRQVLICIDKMIEHCTKTGGLP